MSIPPNQTPRFVICPCQYCSGHIEFDASSFGKDETRKAECPHCKLETFLFVPAQTPKPNANVESVKSGISSIKKVGKTIGEIAPFASGKFERFVFTLVRFFAVFWAGVIVLGIVTSTINYISTFFPSNDTLYGHAIQSPFFENLGIYLCALFILFCVLTMISFVLLLLAIERNTRKKE